jgi:predicted Holliday junction resolvase-like endonuclease
MTIILKYWKLILSGFAVFAIICGLFYIKSLRAEVASLQQTTQAQQAAIEQLMKSIKNNQQALIHREAENKQLVQENNTALKTLEKTYDKDEAAKAWSLDNIPDSVFDELFK